MRGGAQEGHGCGASTASSAGRGWGDLGRFFGHRGARCRAAGEAPTTLNIRGEAASASWSWDGRRITQARVRVGELGGRTLSELGAKVS